MRRMPGIFCMRTARTQVGILWVEGFLGGRVVVVVVVVVLVVVMV